MNIRFRYRFFAILLAIAATVASVTATESGSNAVSFTDVNEKKLSSNPQQLASSHLLRSRGNSERKLRAFDETCTAAVRVTNDEEYGDEENEADDSLECETLNGKFYPVTTPGSYVQERMGDGTLVPGETKIELSNAHIDENTGELFSHDISLTNSHHGNRNMSKMGTRTMIMVRVIAKDSTTSGSISQMTASLLANKAQLLRCSHDRFTLQAADGKSGIDTKIENGVLEIKLPNTSVSVGDGVMKNLLIDEINRQFAVTNPTQLSDHIMLCLPKGTMTRSYANLGGWLSVMNDNSCLHPGTWIHELGHNLYLHHSNEGNAEYMDTTGLMGNYWYGNDELMCFNGPKSWQLGWYVERHLEINADKPRYEGLLGSVISDPAQDGPPIIIKVGLDNYLTFNSATGMTAGTAEAKNQVTITKQSRDGQKSHLQAKIGPSGSYTITDMDPKCKVTISSVQIQDATAQVLVELLGTTGSPVSSPTSSKPTNAPQTKTPTATPSYEPSTPNSSFGPTPSYYGTGEPTNGGKSPTKSPSASPSTSPSAAPTAGKDVCEGLAKGKCKKLKDACVFGKSKIFGICAPKKGKWKHDCAQYKTSTACSSDESEGLCKMTDNLCTHICGEDLAKKACNKVRDTLDDKKTCKMPKMKNPCKGCHPASEC